MMKSSNGNIFRITGVRGIHRSLVNSPHRGQWRGALMLSLICAWIKGWVNNREAGDLRRYRRWLLCHCNGLLDNFNDIPQGYFPGARAILPQCQWSNPSGYQWNCKPHENKPPQNHVHILWDILHTDKTRCLYKSRSRVYHICYRWYGAGLGSSTRCRG